jgi:hypothetical protein
MLSATKGISKMNTGMDPAFVVAADINPATFSTNDGDNVLAVSTSSSTQPTRYANSNTHNEGFQLSSIPLSGVLAYRNDGVDYGVEVTFDRQFKALYDQSVSSKSNGGHP